MATQQKFEIKNLKDCEAMLEEIPKELHDQIHIRAARIAGSVIREAAKNNLRSSGIKNAEKLAKWIVVTKGKGSASAIDIGPSRTKGFWFAGFIEFGTKGVGRFSGKAIHKSKTKWGGRFYGKTYKYHLSGKVRWRADQPAKPFMAPAFENNRAQIINNYQKYFEKAITRVMRKYNKQKAQEAAYNNLFK